VLDQDGSSARLRPVIVNGECLLTVLDTCRPTGAGPLLVLSTRCNNLGV